MNALFQGNEFDVYIHWMILILGTGVLLAGGAVLASCRSVSGFFRLLSPENRLAKPYRAFYRLHAYYWVVFWYILAAHLMFTVPHVWVPVSGEQLFFVHQVVFFTAIANIILVAAVLSSCRSFLSVLGLFLPANPLSKSGYRRFFGYHSYYWWVLGVSMAGHIIFGMIHAINT